MSNTSTRPVKVRIHGALAQHLGRSEWSLHVKSPIEAIEAIEANTGKVFDFFMNDWLQEYHVVVNSRVATTVEEVTLKHADLQEVDFVPIFHGSGGNNSLAMVFIGVLLIVLVIIAPYIAPGLGVGYSTAVAGVTASGAFIGTMLIGIGVSLLISGISAMLASSSSSETNEKPENRPSYLFSGAINTYRQGGALPIGFGLLEVGSQVISAGVRAVNIEV